MVGIIWAFLFTQGDLLSFSVARRGHKKLLGCSFIGGISTRADTMLALRLKKP